MCKVNLNSISDIIIGNKVVTGVIINTKQWLVSMWGKKRKQLVQRGARRKTFTEDILWLQSIQSWINFHCPTLQPFLMKCVTIVWLLIHPSPEETAQVWHTEVWLLVSLHNSFELQVLKRVVKQHALTERELLFPYLHSFEGGSPYVVCKDLNKEELAECLLTAIFTLLLPNTRDSPTIHKYTGSMFRVSSMFSVAVEIWNKISCYSSLSLSSGLTYHLSESANLCSMGVCKKG